jgi:hypothetical protein
MPHVQVRDVPPDVHAALVRKAEGAGQSLQQFLLGELTRLASHPTMAEVFERVERGPLGRFTPDDTVAALEDERARR